MKDKLTLDQQEYIEEMLNQYNMQDCNACYMPMMQDKPSKNDTPETKYNHLIHEYKNKASTGFQKIIAKIFTRSLSLGKFSADFVTTWV